jgi:hypothetical protein
MINFIMLIHATASVIGLAVNVICQIFLFRLLSQFGLLKTIFLGFGIGFLIVVGIELVCYEYIVMDGKDFFFLALTNLITYAALGYNYFHFLNLGETGRRIRIVRELFESEQGLTRNELLHRYDSREIIKKRLNRLLHNGQVRSENSRYYIDRSMMLMIVKIILILKWLIFGKTGDSRTETSTSTV